MPEHEKEHDQHDTANNDHGTPEPAKNLLRSTLIVGAFFLLILILVSYYHPYLTERIKFLVGSSLSLFVLLAVIVQAVIYRGQWKAMNEQAGVMKQGLEETRNLLRQNEWAFKENHRHANATQTQMQEQSEAMKGQLKAMRDSLTQNQEAMEKSSLFANAQGIASAHQIIAMRQQTFAMQGQLAAMNRQEGHLLTQATATKDAADMAKEQLEAMKQQATLTERNAVAAEKSVEATKHAFYVGQKAYIGITAIKMDRLTAGQVPNLSVTWKNGGKTPAWNFRAVVELVLSKDIPYRELGYADEDFSDISGSFLPSDAERTVPYHQGHIRPDQELLQELWGGQQRRLWCCITAVFRDISGETQWFNNMALYDVTEQYFIEAFEYVGYEQAKEQAEAYQSNPKKPN